MAIFGTVTCGFIGEICMLVRNSDHWAVRTEDEVEIYPVTGKPYVAHERIAVLRGTAALENAERIVAFHNEWSDKLNAELSEARKR